MNNIIFLSSKIYISYKNKIPKFYPVFTDTYYAAY